MPVIGHALVGLATAASIPLDPQPPVAPTRRSWTRDAWTLLVVVLAYLPDIAAQVLHALGVADVSRLTHSLGFVVIAVPVAGLLLAAGGLTSVRRGTVVALLSIVLHITLDVLQGTDRAILWPLLSHRLSLGFAVLPRSLVGELAVTSLALGALACVSRARLRPMLPTRVAVLPAVGVVLILGLAVATHAMRDRRERQLRAAKYLVEEQHAYREALELLDQAERWPSPAKPGRVDYLRASAFAALNDRQQAERCYLRSYEADPGYFWTVADLALFYASGPQPVAVRRQAVAPYVARLSGSFARHPETRDTLRRVEQRLGAGSS